MDWTRVVGTLGWCLRRKNVAPSARSEYLDDRLEAVKTRLLLKLS
jgi:hypothetical protein